MTTATPPAPTVTPRKRQLATGGNPEAPASVPSITAFKDDVEYIESSDLRDIARALIAQHTVKFGHLNNLKVVYLWRAKGGQRDGKPALGSTSKPGGLLRYFSKADFVISAAADIARERMLKAWQLEALVYHQLLYAGANEDTGTPEIWYPDYKGFASEVEQYGEWRAELKVAKRAFEQMPLFEDEG